MPVTHPTLTAEELDALPAWSVVQTWKPVDLVKADDGAWRPLDGSDYFFTSGTELLFVMSPPVRLVHRAPGPRDLVVKIPHPRGSARLVREKAARVRDVLRTEATAQWLDAIADALELAVDEQRLELRG